MPSPQSCSTRNLLIAAAAEGVTHAPQAGVSQPASRVKGEIIPSIEENAIKSLGKRFDASLNDRADVTNAIKQTDEWLKINKLGLPGKFKTWLYQYRLLPGLLWFFTVYKFPMRTWLLVVYHLTTSASGWGLRFSNQVMHPKQIYATTKMSVWLTPETDKKLQYHFPCVSHPVLSTYRLDCRWSNTWIHIMCDQT